MRRARAGAFRRVRREVGAADMRANPSPTRSAGVSGPAGRSQARFGLAAAGKLCALTRASDQRRRGAPGAACRSPPCRWSSPGRRRAHLGAHRGGRARGGRRSSATGPNAAARALKTGAARTIVAGRARHHEPVLRRAAARRADRGARRRLRGRADRHGQRPRAGAPRRPRRCTPGPPTGCCCSRSTRRRRPAGSRADRRDRVREPRPSVGAARRPRAAPRPRSATCWSSGHRGSATSRRSTTGRRSALRRRAVDRLVGGTVPRVRTDFSLDAGARRGARAAARPPGR